MSVTSDFISHLKAQSAITALVGSGTSARIYPDIVKETASRPCVVVKKVASHEEMGLLGGLGLFQTVFEVLSLGASRDAADALDDTITDIETGNVTMGSTSVTEITIDGDRSSGADYAVDGSDQHDYWALTRYSIWHT